MALRFRYWLLIGLVSVLGSCNKASDEVLFSLRASDSGASGSGAYRGDTGSSDSGKRTDPGSEIIAERIKQLCGMRWTWMINDMLNADRCELPTPIPQADVLRFSGYFADNFVSEPSKCESEPGYLYLDSTDSGIITIGVCKESCDSFKVILEGIKTLRDNYCADASVIDKWPTPPIR